MIIVHIERIFVTSQSQSNQISSLQPLEKSFDLIKEASSSLARQMLLSERPEAVHQ